MSNLGAKSSEFKKFIYITVILFAVFLIALVVLLDHLNLGSHTISRVPAAITLTVFSWGAIVKWGWKQWPFRLLLRIPVLEGSWTGHLESDWTRETQSGQPIIPIVFVIRQDLLSLTVVSFTEDRHGVSHASQLVANDAAEMIKLFYMYSLREEFRAGEGSQQGAAEVLVVRKGPYELRGEYWTNTKTRGRLILTHQSPHAVGSFHEARSKWGQASWTQFAN